MFCVWGFLNKVSFSNIFFHHHNLVVLYCEVQCSLKLKKKQRRVHIDWARVKACSLCRLLYVGRIVISTWLSKAALRFLEIKKLSRKTLQSRKSVCFIPWGQLAQSETDTVFIFLSSPFHFTKKQNRRISALWGFC